MASLTDRRPVLGFDLDNVLADTDASVRAIVGELFDVHLRREDIVEFDYWRCGISREQSDAALAQFHASCEAEPLEGALEAVEALSGRAAIHIVTARPFFTEALTRQWLRQVGLGIDVLEHSSRKAELAESVPYVALVEDHRETAYAVGGAGVTAFILDRPWNQPQPNDPEGVIRVETWRELRAALDDLLDGLPAKGGG